MEKHIEDIENIKKQIETIRQDELPRHVLQHILAVHKEALCIRDVPVQMALVSRIELVMDEYNAVVKRINESSILLDRIKRRMMECDGIMFPAEKS